LRASVLQRAEDERDDDHDDENRQDQADETLAHGAFYGGE